MKEYDISGDVAIVCIQLRIIIVYLDNLVNLVNIQTVGVNSSTQQPQLPNIECYALTLRNVSRLDKIGKT
jgi:hypothetical protein